MTQLTESELPRLVHTSDALRCSVIVPVYNGGSVFASCVASIQAALRENDELIVVADSDGDGSWRVAEEQGARVLRLPVRKGPARARNAGAELAKGDILFFVDADITVRPDCVRKIAGHFAREPDLAALIGSYDERPGQTSFLSQFKNLFHHYVHQRGGEKASTFWGACGAIRKNVFHDVGGFDERYARPSIEDIELGYRLKAASQRILLAHDIQVTHWKRWDARTLLKTDILDRAAPWTELILDQIVKRKVLPAGDLNLASSFRRSILTSFAIVATLGAGAFVPWLLVLVPLLGAIFVSLHLPLFRFFREQRGTGFCVRAVLWRFGYDLYSGLGFFYGTSRFARRQSIRMLTQAIAPLDPLALGLALGTLGGLGIAGMTVVVVASETSPVARYLALMGNYFPGFKVSWAGALIGFVYGLVAGFVCGYAVAWLRNTMMRLYLGFRKVQRWTKRFAAERRASN
jgi:glycosyltransferase involved in cell wall biosynthesis